MLESVLSEKIADFAVLNPHVPGEFLKDKGIVIDVRVRLRSGKHIIVEMQVRTHTALEARLLYYMARDYSDQLGAGQVYQDLKPTVVIVWLVEPLFPKLGLHSIFEFRERNTHELFSDHLTVHVLQR